MKRILFAAGAALAASLSFTAPAAAQSVGYVTIDLNVRAGPGTEYPRVDVFPGGTRVRVHGCTRGYSWCDVAGRGTRGWVSARYLELSHRNRRVVVPDYAPAIGLPIITFQLGTYWDRYYSDRSWYDDRRWRGDRRRWRDRDRWEHGRDWREDRRGNRRGDWRDDRRERRGDWGGGDHPSSARGVAPLGIPPVAVEPLFRGDFVPRRENPHLLPPERQQRD